MTMLSEAGRLYLKDISVLEEARSALSEYFDAVWAAVRDGVHGGKEIVAPPLTWRESVRRDWIGKGSDYSAELSVLYVSVCDPFGADDAGGFQVWMSCTKKDRDRLRRAGLLDRLVDAAAARKLKLSFDNLEALASRTVVVSGDDAQETGSRVAQALIEMLEHAGALHEIAAPGLAASEK